MATPQDNYLVPGRAGFIGQVGNIGSANGLAGGAVCTGGRAFRWRLAGAVRRRPVRARHAGRGRHQRRLDFHAHPACRPHRRHRFPGDGACGGRDQPRRRAVHRCQVAAAGRGRLGRAP